MKPDNTQYPKFNYNPKIKITNTSEKYRIIDKNKEVFVKKITRECKKSPLIIPKIIHQIWIGPNPPPWQWINTFKKDYVDAYPDWKYYLWREKDIEKLELVNQKWYDKESFISGKTDILRYEILYQFGGIYIDADSVWLNKKSLNDLIEQTNKLGFFAGREYKKLIANGVIGASKKNPILKYIIGTLNNIYPKIRKFYNFAWITTGPIFFTAVLKNIPITIFPPKVFYPKDWHNVDVNTDLSQYPDSYMFQYGYMTNKRGNYSNVYAISICLMLSKPKEINYNNYFSLVKRSIEAIVKATSKDIEIELVIACFNTDQWLQKQWIKNIKIDKVKINVIEIEGDINIGLERNKAAQKATHENLLFLDEKVLIDNHTIRKGISFLEWGIIYYPIFFCFITKKEDVGIWWPHKNNMFITKKLLHRAGWWPQQLLKDEDVGQLFYQKIKTNNLKIKNTKVKNGFIQYYKDFNLVSITSSKKGITKKSRNDIFILIMNKLDEFYIKVLNSLTYQTIKTQIFKVFQE